VSQNERFKEQGRTVEVMKVGERFAGKIKRVLMKKCRNIQLRFGFGRASSLSDKRRSKYKI
jgi:hypothetical protein